VTVEAARPANVFATISLNRLSRRRRGCGRSFQSPTSAASPMARKISSTNLRMGRTAPGRMFAGVVAQNATDRRSVASTPTTTRTGYTTASAAIRFSSIPKQSLNPARAGPASGRLLRRKMSQSRGTTHLGCKEMRFCAGGATLIWGMFLTMGRLPLTCAIA
jgi:hypothetical protein